MNYIVHGQAAGNFECAGRIWIDKGGLIEGRIAAHSVDRRTRRNSRRGELGPTDA